MYAKKMCGAKCQTGLLQMSQKQGSRECNYREPRNAFYVADKTSVIESNEIAVKIENEVEPVAQFNVVFIAIFLNADNFCAFMIF